jgi:hypothetical protein
MFLLATFRSTAAAALAALALGTAQAAPVATYSFGAADFVGGGFLSGSLTATLLPSATLPPPFVLPSGSAGLAEVLAFEASFSGNARLPDAQFDASELQSVRLLDSGTFAGSTQTVQSVPAILEILAFDDETEVSLQFLFAASQELFDAFLPFAAPGARRGAEINDTSDDTGRRFTLNAGAELIGASFDPTLPPPVAQVPEPGGAARAGVALLAAALVRRRRR